MVDVRELEKVMKVFANRRRLAIVKYLAGRREASVGDIARELKISFTATSKHLNRLLIVDVLECEQRSLKVFYRLAGTQRPIAKALLGLF
ncbi:MAG: ArsR family transcriptional regulator [bacterium]|nr:ArsR family transcriptional regulator [bacterium]